MRSTVSKRLIPRQRLIHKIQGGAITKSNIETLTSDFSEVYLNKKAPKAKKSTKKFVLKL